MRNLQTGDVFNLARLVKRLDIKEELKNIAVKVSAKNKQIKEENNLTDEEEKLALGFDLMFGVIEKFTEVNAEEELYKFLSGPFQISSVEIKEMDPFELIKGVMEIASIEKWTNFLKQAIR